MGCPPKAGPVVMGVVQLVDTRERLLRKRHKPEQIVSILCDIQSDLNAGLSVDQALRKAGIGFTTYYRWKAQQLAPVSAEASERSYVFRGVPRLQGIFTNHFSSDGRRITSASNASISSGVSFTPVA